MTNNFPDVASLRAIQAVADHPTMAEAAEALHLSQPAVSKRVSETERRLGLVLFDRVGKRLELTAQGRTLLAEARPWLNEQARLADLAQELAGNRSLRLATSHHIGLHLLPPILRELRAGDPDLNIELSFLDSEAAYEAVEQGSVDVALATLNPDRGDELDVTPLWQDVLNWWVHPSHPLAADPEGTLTDHLALLPEAGTYTRTLIEGQVTLGDTLVSNYLETLAAMVDAGLGWSVLPARLAQPHWVALRRPQLVRELGAITDPRRHGSVYSEALIRHCGL